MIRLKKGNGILQSFFIDGFFFLMMFFLWLLQMVFDHPCMLPPAGLEGLLHLYINVGSFAF